MNIKPCMDKITGTWELLLSDYWRNGMIIDEKIDLQSSWKKNSCQSFGLIPFRILSVRTNFCQSQITFNKMNCDLMLTSDTPTLRQTGSRNLMGPKTLPTIWGTYMKLLTKYQISAINSCWEKCDEQCAYMYVQCV